MVSHYYTIWYFIKLLQYDDMLNYYNVELLYNVVIHHNLTLNGNVSNSYSLVIYQTITPYPIKVSLMITQNSMPQHHNPYNINVSQNQELYTLPKHYVIYNSSDSDQYCLEGDLLC